MYWKIRLNLKILAGRIPALKRVFQGLGYFRHGRMDFAPYASGVFNRHFAHYTAPKGGTCMEIGPGDSLLTAMLARVAGFNHTLLVDDGRQIRENMGLYVSFSRILREQGHDIPEVKETWTIEDFLREFSAEYLTGGLLSLRAMPDTSVDFSFSHAVMEHIPRSQAGEYLRQLKRVSKPGGLSSHHVDLKDHLGGSLQHLRFSSSEWESEKVRRSGVYTNRLRYSEWLSLLEEVTVDYRIITRTFFPALPLRRQLLASEFRDLAEDDLRTLGFHVVFAGPSKEGAQNP